MQVNNTDAEGRLVLADVLVYTCKLGVEKVNALFYLEPVNFDQI